MKINYVSLDCLICTTAFYSEMQTQYPYSNAYSINQCQSFLSISHLIGTLDSHFQFLHLIPKQFFRCLCDNFVFSAAQAPNYLLVLFFFHSLIPFYHISCPTASDHSHHYHTSPYDCHLVAEVIAKVSSSKIRSLSLSSKTSHGSLPFSPSLIVLQQYWLLGVASFWPSTLPMDRCT